MSRRPPLIWISVAGALIVVACSTPRVAIEEESLEMARQELNDNVAFVTQNWPTDWTRAVVDLDELILGVAATDPRDAIPPIDTPKYESVSDASKWLANREPGAIVQIDGDARFFALSIMNRHEIVNTEIGDVPVVVTYCPLCNTALAFERRIDEEVLRFGVSGLLRNSDLVMWDARTVSLWQQITGESVVGQFSGTQLELVSTAIVSFGDFSAGFPDGLSLSRDTGFDITYGTNPYEGYTARVAPLMPINGDLDGRFPALERVVGVSVGGVDKAYPFSRLSDERVVNDTVGGVPVSIFWGSPDTADALDRRLIVESQAVGTAIAFNRTVDGEVLTFESTGDVFRDAQTGSAWSILGEATSGPLAGTRLDVAAHRNEFWFVWIAFFPDADVYSVGS